MSARVFHHIAVTCFLTGGPREGPPTCLHTLIIAPAEGTCKVCIVTTTATTATITAQLGWESATRTTLLLQEGVRRRGVDYRGRGGRELEREREGEKKGDRERERNRRLRRGIESEREEVTERERARERE